MKQKAMGRKISYLEIAEEMRRTLRSGIFSPGEAVISGRALAREKGVSFGTANKAIAHLAKEGFLERRIGSGTFVRSRKRKSERKKKFTVGFARPFFYFPEKFSPPQNGEFFESQKEEHFHFSKNSP